MRWCSSTSKLSTSCKSCVSSAAFVSGAATTDWDIEHSSLPWSRPPAGLAKHNLRCSHAPAQPVPQAPQPLVERLLAVLGGGGTGHEGGELPAEAGGPVVARRLGHLEALMAETAGGPEHARRVSRQDDPPHR